MYRELDEEVGLKREHVSILAQTRGWHRYKLPSRYVRRHEKPVCIGQKQKWFLLRLDAPDSAVCLDAHDSPEFDDWRWVNFWYPLAAVVDFKRDVYQSAMSELVSGLAPRPRRKRKRRRG
jgi:putative (di)nucleoside polyphosphate hydrolase